MYNLYKIKQYIKAGIQPAFSLLPYMPSIILFCSIIVLSHFICVEITGYRANNYDIDRWWITHFFDYEFLTILLLIVAGKEYTLFGWYCVVELIILWLVNTLHMYNNLELKYYYMTYTLINSFAIIVTAVRHVTSLSNHNEK